MKALFKFKGRAYFRHRNAQRACPSQGFTIRNVQGNYESRKIMKMIVDGICVYEKDKGGSRNGKYTAGNYCAGKI